MVIPIDLLKTRLEELLANGTVDSPARPWLGVYATQVSDRIIVMSKIPYGPAGKADLEKGDIIMEVADMPVSDLATFYRKVWALGEAGVPVPMRLSRNGRDIAVTVKSADRRTFLKTPRTH